MNGGLPILSSEPVFSTVFVKVNCDLESKSYKNTKCFVNLHFINYGYLRIYLYIFAEKQMGKTWTNYL